MALPRGAGSRMDRMPRYVRSAFVSVALVAATTPGLAHEAAGVAGGLSSGFTHPLFGPDHLVAMVAVGLWGAFLGAPAIYLLPVVFPMVMAAGGVSGIVGVELPYVEAGIAASGIVLGLFVALAVRPPLAVAAVVVGVFAIFHGHAHGTELPEAADPVSYGVGFVVGTGVLHLAGIALGSLVRWPWGRTLVRAAGGAIAATGLWFLAT